MATLDDYEKLGDAILAGKTPAKKRTKFDDYEDAGDKILTATPPPVVAAPPVAPPPPRWTEDNPLFAMGDPREALPPSTTDAGRIVGAMGQGWRAAPQLLTPEDEEAQKRLWGPYLGGAVNTIYQGVSAIPAAGNALLYGGAELANQITGDPRAGRDVVQLGQVLPFAHIGTGVPPVAKPPNPLDQPRFARERTTAPPRPAGMTDAERINQLIEHDTAEQAPPGVETRAGPRVGKVPPVEEGPAAPNTTGDVHAGEAPSPRSGGAAATPGEAIPDQTRVERARNLRVSINETARDRAGPSLVDDRAYVTTLPNSPDPLPPRMRPERDFDPQTALDHKERYGEDAKGYRADYDANHAARNQGMRDLLEHDAGDGITLEQARTARREVAPDQFGAFDGERPVDASGFRGRIQRLLDSTEGKREAVERTLNNVLGRLHDREGNLETMPSTLYGVRKHIDDLIEKARKGTDREGTDAAASVHILRDMAHEMDDLIQSGATRYQAYRDAYREASQPVNQQRFLQQYQGGTKKLWDKDGNLQKQAVDRMLEDIHKGLADTKFNLAQSLTDEQIQNVINVRNELAARTLRDTQAAVPGSPTVQLLNQAAKRGSGPLGKTLKNVGELALHGAAIYGEGGASLLNVPIGAWQVTRHIREATREAKKQADLDSKTNALKQRLLSQEPVNPLSLYDN